jgi:type III secretion protein T
MTGSIGDIREFLGSIDDPLMLGAPRALAMMAVFPMLPSTSFPMMLRNGIAIALVMPMYPVLKAHVPDAPTVAWEWLAFMLKEAAIGAAIGWSFGMLIWTLEMVGSMLEIQSGTATSVIFNPASGELAGIYTQFLRDTAIVLFLSLGGLLAMSGALFHSFVVWPVTEPLPRSPEAAWHAAVGSSSRFLSLGLSLGLPLVVALLVIELGLGLMNRSLPQLNVFSLSMPLKMLGAMFGLTLIFGYYFDRIAQWLADGRFSVFAR